MTYGEHYRKKVEAALELERRRCADLLAEQKKKASAQKVLTPLKKSLVSPHRRTRPRYDLNELRHHQRRCAALLFGARERGAHKLPVLVQWAPKRRESYYLMSERVFNDRVLMKMRADAGDSPLDFANTDGDTDNLHEFQKFVNKTSKDIKQLSFDTKYKDYTYDFGEDKEKQTQEEGTRTTEGDQTTDSNKGRRKVVFSDRVTESDTDAIDAKPVSLARTKQRQKGRLIEGLDPNDIDLNFDSEDEIPDGEHQTASERGPGSEKSKKKHSKSLRKGSFSPDLLSFLQGTEEYSSDFTSEEDPDSKTPGDEDSQGLPFAHGEEYSVQSQRDERKLHRNKHCRHSLKQKTQDYYSQLPKLLKTAELRAKLPSKSQQTHYDILQGMEANHKCMNQHKVAYDRALTVARFRSLPFSYSFLSRNVNSMHSFSYFPGLPGSEKVTEEEEDDNSKKKKLKEVSPAGREAIFGELDMDDFYSQEDELIYFIKPEELKNVVASATSSAESSRKEEDISSPSNTTYTSTSNTVKPSSDVESENEL